MTEIKKKILYVDMDNVLVDFRSAFPHFDSRMIREADAINKADEVDGLFGKMTPMPGAIEAVTFLARHFDAYILSTAPWRNPSAWIDKVKWVHSYLPEVMYKRLIITHHKNLNRGDYLIDDRDRNGVDKFEGEHIHFGKGHFKGWGDVIRYLCDKEGIPNPKRMKQN